MAIDWGQVVAPEALAARRARERGEAVRAELRRRLDAVAVDTTMLNIIGAQAAGAFDGPTTAAYVAAVQWIGAMRAAAATLAAGTGDFTADAAWPPCPAPVAALAAAFGGGRT